MSTSVDDSRVEELFALARDLPPLQQAALLDTEIPSGATALRSAVEELLLAFRQAPPGEFVNRLAPPSALQRCLDAAWEEECDSDYAPGDVIGPYRLLEMIGEGGMGVVYMAQQSSPIVRRVALKLIRPGVTGDEFVARFEAERQALSLMDHPCITKVFDAGCVERGRPYLVMELIKGVPISTYCDQRCLTTSERLSLFAQVCRGVAHAHQKGVIHRDLKPSNILVADYDDAAVPKIIDFGVAKAFGEKLVDRTLFTHFGQIVGTLQYMSPEQAKLNQLDVDVRSDVYALGAILYELLTGTTPFELAELRRAAFDEALRMIRHDEPPKPSTRISSSEAPAVVAANRGVDDRTLKRSLSGDLDAIVMTALEKDRGRRYQSAQSFAEDIDRYHQDVAVLARRPSRFEEARRFLRRHVLLVTLTFAGVVTMAAIGTSVITGLRAELARANQRLSERMRQVAVLAAESDFLRPRRAIDSVRFALAAVEKSGENGDTVLPSAHAALLNAVVPINGVPLAPHGELLRDVAFSGKKLIVLTDQAMRVFSLGDVGLFSVEREIFHGDKGFVPGVPGRLPRRMFVSRDGRWAVTDGEKVVRWDLWAETGNPTELFTRAIAPEHRRDLTLSADGAWVGEIDVGETATPRVWRLLPEISTKPIILDTLPCRNPDGMRMEFSPCGRWVGMCVDTSVRVWRLGDDSERFSRHAEFEQSLGFSFSSSGDLIASTRKTTPGKSNEILVWRLNSPDEPPLTYPIRLAANFQSLSFAPNEKHLYITGLHELRVCRVDLTSPSSETVSTYYAGHQNALTGCEITQDGEWMVTSGLDGDARVWPLSGKQPSRSYSVCKVHNRLFRMTIDPSGKWMATCARDGTGRLCRLQDGTLQNSPFVLPGGSKNAGTTVSTSGDGTRVATHGRGNAVACWRIEESGSPALTELGAGDTGVRAVEVSANGKLVLAAYDDASVRLWDFPTNEAPGVAKVLRGPTSEWSGRELTATFIGSSSLVIGHADGSVEVLSGVSGASSFGGASRLNFDSPARLLQASRDGKWLAMVDSMYRLWLWELGKSGAINSPLRLDHQARDVFAMEFAPDGSTLVVADGVYQRKPSDPGRPGRIWIWDLLSSDVAVSKRVLDVESENDRGVWRLAIGPSGRWLVPARFTGKTRLRDLRAGEFADLQRHNGVQTIEISPNGKWLAAGNRHGDVLLWDLESPEPAASGRVLSGHSGAVWSLAFSANSDWLFSDSSDGTVCRWPLRMDVLSERARDIIGPSLDVELVLQQLSIAGPTAE